MTEEQAAAAGRSAVQVAAEEFSRYWVGVERPLPNLAARKHAEAAFAAGAAWAASLAACLADASGLVPPGTLHDIAAELRAAAREVRMDYVENDWSDQ